MQAKQIVARVEELVKPLCEQAGVSLWDVEFEKAKRKEWHLATPYGYFHSYIDSISRIPRYCKLFQKKSMDFRR